MAKDMSSSAAGGAQPRLAVELGDQLAARLLSGERVWLFLDYDGTLAEFAPTPDDILPDQALIKLIGRLARKPELLRVSLLSGRRLAHIEQLMPVPGVLLAGTYGVEYLDWEGKRVEVVDRVSGRALLERVARGWAGLVDGRSDFFIEDKGYAMALHGSRVKDTVLAEKVLVEATRQAREAAEGDTFHLLEARRFIEVAPRAARKDVGLRALLERFAWPESALVYLGDDERDEEAFAEVLRQGGKAVLVSDQSRPTLAQYRLENPFAVRAWLARLADSLGN